MKMQRAIPMLPVRHMPTSVEFYAKLGFAVEKRNDEWRWAMLVLDECRLMVDESINQPPDAPRTSVIYLYPDDIFAFHRDVRRRGVDVPSISHPFYGMSEFRTEDPDGNRLWIGQRTGS
ncbi:VOC family protein [Pseudoxanthomonas sp. LH2527]|uniref:VOC family protein n=1 Tax=Pseudoxanthomonas sp. LH2527 TaxID=2923249 RepID=UPI001F12937F|nr:VOC family protein [Pseudoxanthomonas sp. LH2527]MCH6483670.1 VOC family protein [Pseudoxanthomonas sp. LH2527]